MSKKRIAVFASGGGTNAEKIFDYFKNDAEISIVRLYVNKADAYVIERAKKFGIPIMVFNRDEYYNTDLIVGQLQEDKTDLIVLAGFLWLVPSSMIQAYPNQIVNIHPALLPNYGGKGMYGMNVHKAVVAAHETESGITIHYTNENYDEGNTIAQYRCAIEPSDSPEEVQGKVLVLEHKYYPLEIEKLLRKS